MENETVIENQSINNEELNKQEENKETERSLVSVLALNVKGQLGKITTFFSEHNLNILRLVLSAADKDDKIHRTIAYLEGDRKYVNDMCKELEKVENVVKPPQKPTVKNSLNSLGTLIFSIKSKNPKPIIKLPIILTLSVPRGKHPHNLEQPKPVK